MTNHPFSLWPRRQYGFDVETYPNVFTATFIGVESGTEIVFEVSDRCNDLPALRPFLKTLIERGASLVGYNCAEFDWPLLVAILKNPYRYDGAASIYNRADQLIHSEQRNRLHNPGVELIDLFLINHYGNAARFTSLKKLEFNMKSPHLADLPYPVGEPIPVSAIPALLAYNRNDVLETLRFYRLPQNQSAVEFRRSLAPECMGMADTDVGNHIMRTRTSAAGMTIGSPDYDNALPVEVGRVILPLVGFRRPECVALLEYFRGLSVVETKGAIEQTITLDGFRFDYGLGGVHGSVSGRDVRACDGYVIIDLDVASYYPNIAIKNSIYPRHLGPEFCSVYESVFEQRRAVPKKDPLNAALKLALNAVFGNSNNPYSWLYDPWYTLAITVNGQLMLTMLAESLLEMDSLELLQINTDGLTVRCPASSEPAVMERARAWERLTRLTLERADYSRMIIRDVNNYVAVRTDGVVKLKGAYDTAPEMHKNHSNIASKRAALAAMLEGADIEQTLRGLADPFEFFIMGKCDRSSRLELDGRKTQSTMRYYVSRKGKKLEKVMPPLGPVGRYKLKRGVHSQPSDGGVEWNPDYHTQSKAVYDERRTWLESGRLVTQTNDFNGTMNDIAGNIDWSYYVEEATKLVIKS